MIIEKNQESDMNANTNRLSIVMATHNGARYLEQQLLSLSRQTVSPMEIIISDDGSGDKTFEILKAFKESSAVPVSIIMRNPKLGYGENFLQTALKAKGDFVAFCDQDDIWKENKIEKCSEYFCDPNISLIVHPAATIDENSKIIGEFRQGITSNDIKKPLSYDLWGTFWGFSIIFRRDLLHVFPIEERFVDYIVPEHKIAHDRWICFVGQMLGSTAEIDENLVLYRQHASNLFGKGLSFRFRPKHNVKERTDLYINVSQQMLSIVDAIETETLEKFPSFRKSACIDFLERSIAQLHERRKIYRERRVLKALWLVSVAVLKGSYRRVENGRMRWRSVYRDILFFIAKR